MENSAHGFSEGSEPIETHESKTEQVAFDIARKITQVPENKPEHSADHKLHSIHNIVMNTMRMVERKNEEKLAFLKKENFKLKELLKESHKAFEYGELELRTTYKRFTGYKGSSSLWAMQGMIEKLKPFSDNK